MTSFQEIAKAALDDEAVEDSPHTYRDMIYRQLQVPVGVGLLFTLALLYFGFNAIVAGVGVVITLFTMLPVVGAYLYHRERDSPDTT